MRRLRLSESNLLVILAVVIGVIGGLAAVGLQSLIDLFRAWFFDLVGLFESRFAIILAPVLGALVAGPLIYRFAIEAKGHGVPEVMESVALRGGRIRPRVALVKAAASAVTIGSGGSAGREGPIVQIGATLGSAIAQLFKMSERRMRTLVAAGAAAGIAAAFNAPLAGVFFALEVILQRFTARGFATVVLSAVTASVIWRAFFGNAPVFSVPAFPLAHPAELGFYVVLGIAAALVAIIFVWFLYKVEDRFDALPILPDIRPAVGALVVGLLGVWSILVLGSGTAGINAALTGNVAMTTLLLLLGAKVVATAFTLGSGASGGVFSPSLFLGAMLGGALGSVFNELAPGVAILPEAYALVGMAAVFAAAAQAPITSILIVFEMTNDFRIMIPLMLACVTSAAIYSLLKRDSIYMVKLRRRGVDLEQGRERHLLETIPLARAVEVETPTLQLPTTVRQVADLLEASNQDVALVTDRDGTLVGAVYPEAVREALAEEVQDVGGIVQTDVPVASPIETLDDGLRMLTLRDLQVIPVVDADRRVVGVVSQSGILTAYRNALAEAERGAGPPPG